MYQNEIARKCEQLRKNILFSSMGCMQNMSFRPGGPGMKEFKINLSKGEVLYTGSYICALSKTPASTPEQISLEAVAEKLAEELIMQQAMNREHQRRRGNRGQSVSAGPGRDQPATRGIKTSS
nr:hypothetical protein [Bacillus subtilis]